MTIKSRDQRISAGGSNANIAWLLVSLALVGTIILPGCRSEPQGQGPGKRVQVLALSPDQELEIGREAFQKVQATAHPQKEGPEAERVRRVGQRIANAVAIESLQREINLHVADYQFEWEYLVLQDEQKNAFCLPGGKIVVFSGLLQFVRNDDQLATVISHEVAHALAHHSNERIALERTTANGLLRLAYSREQELEADHIGVFLMTFAGYDPDQAVEFWEEMMKAHAASLHLPEILSDHPNDAHRTKQMKNWAGTAKAGKAAFDAGRISRH